MIILIFDFNSSTLKIAANFEFDDFHVKNSVSKYLLESRNNFNLQKNVCKMLRYKYMTMLKRIKSKMYKEDVFVHSNDALQYSQLLLVMIQVVTTIHYRNFDVLNIAKIGT